MGEELVFDLKGLKKTFRKTGDFFKNKKVQNIITIIFLLSIVFLGIYIRVQNLDLLVDQTTGEYIPTALDPFYFLRMTETIAEQGGLPEYDSMRHHPIIETAWSHELWPYFTVQIHKIIQLVSAEATLQFTAVIFPVIFFILGIIAFFFLTLLVTNSKISALVSSAFLTVLPTYLFRSMAGFYDHEPNGMFFFITTIAIFILSINFLENQKNKSTAKSLVLGSFLGLMSILTLFNWSGVANFLFMIIPLGFILIWLIKIKNLKEDQNSLDKYSYFYISFFISSIIFGIIFGFSLSRIISFIALNSSSLLNGFVVIFLLVDLVLTKIGNENFKVFSKNRIVNNFIITLILGIILISLLRGNIFSTFSDLISRILQPFGGGRVGLTVAENRQPFLNDWISQTGEIFYWIFIGGLVAFGINISKKIKVKSNRYGFLTFWIVLLLGILYSRISIDSLFNGINFISKVFYFGSILLFIIFCIKIYIDKREDLKIPSQYMIVFSWMVFMMIGARGAIRLFFVITPFTCLSAGILFDSLIRAAKKEFKRDGSKEGSLKKIFIILISLALIIGSVLSFINLTQQSVLQAGFTGPSANEQWQNAMEWVRDNTLENSIFIHWWDYGYWVQYLGERATLSDGGQFQKDYGNHLVGRYVLTSPSPEASMSFIKSNQATHLLIDQTDLGKYSAYSRIGSDSNWDRFSIIPVLRIDSGQTQISEDNLRLIYSGTMGVDEDILYRNSDGEIFLPGPKYDSSGNPSFRSYFIGLLTDLSQSNGERKFEQPLGIYLYNNQRYDLPIRYIFNDGEIIDFGEGIDSVAMIVPSLDLDQGANINEFGAMVYLSPRTKDSLFSQLYLMNDPLKKYEGIELVHSENHELIKNLESQGLYISEFMYYQNSLRGPIKIWDTRNISEDIIINEEFLLREGDYAEFDNLDFVKTV